MRRSIIFVLLVTLLYHLGYKQAVATEIAQATQKSHIVKEVIQDNSAYKDWKNYLLIDTGSLLNESEDEQESLTTSKANFSTKWSLYHYNKAESLVTKNVITDFDFITTRNKEKYIFIGVFRV